MEACRLGPQASFSAGNCTFPPRAESALSVRIYRPLEDRILCISGLRVFDGAVIGP